MKSTNYSKLIAIILPNSFIWTVAALFFLIYSFDMIDYVQSRGTIHLLADSGAVTLALMLSLAFLGLFFTGHYLDKKPESITILVTVGVFGCALAILGGMMALMFQNGLLISLSLLIIGLFLGIAAASSGTLFGGMVSPNLRGRVFSLAIVIFAIVVMLIFFVASIIRLSFIGSSIMISLFGIIVAVAFFLIARNWKYWKNDKWPTKFQEIVKRRPVICYVLTQFFVFLLLGMQISTISHSGNYLGFNWSMTLSPFGDFNLDPYKTFWFVVLFGDLLTVLLAGYLSDKIGRRPLVILSVYGIFFAALVFGLEQTEYTFLFSAFVIGISFSLLQTSLNSSIWADLSPKDAIGRYYSLGFIALTFGLGLGFSIGYWVFLPYLSSSVTFYLFILVAFAIVSVLPLFFVTDSFPQLELYLLLVIKQGGSPIFDYDFGRKIKSLNIELPLVSSALTAVSSFMSEIIDKKANLSLVKHGSYFILSKAINSDVIGEELSAVIFTNKNDQEIQRLLKKFLLKFHDSFGERVKNWDGSMSTFTDAVNIAEELFGPIIGYTI